MEHGVFYQIELRFGVNEDAARLALLETEGEGIRWLRPEGEGFLWRLGENGVAYQYNLRTVRLSDAWLSHTGAALSERGTMLILTCDHGDRIPEETVRGTMLYMLENLQFTGPAIAEENYQDQLRPAVSMGFSHCGQALFRAPEGLFPYDAYLDTFLPCGGEVHYYDGGISMMTKAHGLRVSAAVVPNEGTALDVVKEIYTAEGRAVRTEAHGLRVYAAIVPGENAKAVIEERQRELEATGLVYEEDVDDQFYREDLNAAGKLTVYQENGRRRNAILHAEELWEDWYLLREITGVEERMDEEYLPLLKELESMTGLTIPVLEQLEEES